MDRSTSEIEIKLPFASAEQARQRLETIGARETVPRQFEDNVLFERQGDRLQAAGQALRLRRGGTHSLLTFKGRVEGAHAYKVREEHETRVADADATQRILGRLGLVPSYRYQKYRTEFALEHLHVCLDETPLGCFVELEGTPADIDRAAAQLGFRREHYVLDSYRGLHERAVRAGTFAAGDLLVEPEGRSAP